MEPAAPAAPSIPGIGTGGGAAGTTGTGGAAGTGGTGIAATPLPPPQCLLDLIATCPLAGPCQYSDSGDGSKRFCLAGGATVSVVETGGSGTNEFFKSVTEVRRSDGTLCYSIEGLRDVLRE